MSKRRRWLVGHSRCSRRHTGEGEKEREKERERKRKGERQVLPGKVKRQHSAKSRTAMRRNETPKVNREP
eukprot:2128703-Rhodomonas_salina.1